MDVKMSENEDFSSIEDFSYMNIVNPDKMENKLVNQVFQMRDLPPETNTFDESDSKKKKVHFPEEKEIVSDYFESKNYWTEHKFCSSDELIYSYKKACEHCNVKPIPILLEQLKGIDAKLCHERYDMLNLSNVKLDLKQIECMEEIFKRVQFKNLNFENTSLDDESSASLFEIIEFYESCSKLNISFNSKIQYIGFNACSKMLKKTPFLECIELKGIMFTETTIPPLNRALRCGSNLKILHLENSNICSKNLLILTSALKLNIHMRELHLASNRMVPSDGIQLGSLLKVNRHIELLDVRNNSLGDIGLSHICDGLCEQFLPQPIKEDENHGPGLLCLILWSNSITYNGMPALSDALKVNRSIQSLNLGNNPISSEGIHGLRDGLLVNRSLLRLSLPCCRITCEGGVAIAEYLADTKQLMRLDLRDNDIKTAGLMAISHSMKVNKSIIRLDLDQVSKRDPNVKGYTETQQESLRIIQERVQENKKAVIRSQDADLAHNCQSLSTNTHAVNETSDSQIMLPNDPYAETMIPDQSNMETSNASLDNISDVVDEPHIQIDGPSPEENVLINNNVVIANFSLSFSTEMETSFELPSIISNNFSNKVLSPTDTILECNKSSEFILSGCDGDNDYIVENKQEMLNTSDNCKPELITMEVEDNVKEKNAVSNLLSKSEIEENVHYNYDSNNIFDGLFDENIIAKESNHSESFEAVVNGDNIYLDEPTKRDLNFVEHNEAIDN